MGGRLRRAAGLYRRALQEQQTDDLSAFQYGYMGLEALEPALAEQMGVSSGVEETKGKCRACGAEFIRRKTMLAGVRAYIMGNNHPSTAGSHRETEWKGINDLRQNQFHSLRDPEDLYADARAVVPAAAHFLHDAICCLSHAHDLEEPTFWLERGARILLRGDSEPAIDDPLEECRPVAGFREVRWTVDREFGYVPEVRFVHNRPGANIHC